MKKEIIKKIGEVLELAATLNPTETDQEVTGEKPTVFVHLYGHVARLQVSIYMHGWGDEEPFNSYDRKWNIKYDNAIESEEPAERQLDEIIEILENLVERWRENG